MVSNRKKKNKCSPGRGRRTGHNTARNDASPDKPEPGKPQPKQSNPKRLSGPYGNKTLKQKFGKGDVMNSAQRIVDMQRRNANYLSQTEFCSAPPARQDLVRARFVIPGEQLVPKALRDLGVLDDIRREHKVWITREAGTDTLFDLTSNNVKSLHAALDAISQKIHDIRLSEESLTAHYFVQSPKKDGEIMVSFEINKRPCIEDPAYNSHQAEHVLDGLVAQFAAALPPSLKTLVAVPGLRMQINFGHLNILTKRKNMANRVSLEEYKSALDSYTSRGRGVRIEPEIPNIEAADTFLSSILDNEEIVKNKKDLVFHHQVQFDVDKQTVSADLQVVDGIAKPHSSKCAEIEGHLPLDWIVSAPAMNIDWNLRVSSRRSFLADRSGQLLVSTTRFVQSFAFTIDGDTIDTEPSTPSKEADEARRHFKLPRWQTPIRGALSQMPSKFRVRSYARLQYQDTPYEMEVSTTQHWAEMPVSAKPDRQSWSVSVYGIHWDEALNERKSGGWSNGLEEAILSRLWPGQGSLEERLKDFLECVFSVQTAIAKLKS